jgi:tripeptide aminopeptidase
VVAKTRNTNKTNNISTNNNLEGGEAMKAKTTKNETRTGLPVPVNVQLLTDVLSVEAYYDKDQATIDFIMKYMEKLVEEQPKEVFDLYFDEAGNLYVSKNTPPKGKYYPCSVAHCDTVHKITGNLVIVNLKDQILTGMDAVTARPSGCGGDDGVGVYINLEMLRRLKYVKCAFFRNEEGGMVGSSQADMGFFEDVAFVLQADRMGNSDFIRYTNNVTVYSKAFGKAVRPILNLYKYAPCDGLATDVGQLKINGLEVSCANVSCGYYRPHADSEYVDLYDVEMCLNLFIDLFSTLSDRQWTHILDKAELDTKVYRYTWTKADDDAWERDWKKREEDYYRQKYFSSTSGTSGTSGTTGVTGTPIKPISGNAVSDTTSTSKDDKYAIIKKVLDGVGGTGNVYTASDLVKRDQDNLVKYLKRGGARQPTRIPTPSDYDWSCRLCGSEEMLRYIEMADGWYCEGCGEFTPNHGAAPKGYSVIDDDETDMKERGGYGDSRDGVDRHIDDTF